MLDMTDTVIPKSNQLNADDLISGDLTITITSVDKSDTPEQPVALHYENEDGRPYKPCKSMRRALIHAWGKNGNDWVGKSIQLYRDPEVKWAGEPVGGIRIRALSHIDHELNLKLTVTRAKRALYKIAVLKPVAPEFYPDDKFNAQLERMSQSIKSGKSTPEKIIAHLEKTAPLTEKQQTVVLNMKQPEPEIETDDEEVF